MALWMNLGFVADQCTVSINLTATPEFGANVVHWAGALWCCESPERGKFICLSLVRFMSDLQWYVFVLFCFGFFFVLGLNFESTGHTYYSSVVSPRPRS